MTSVTVAGCEARGCSQLCVSSSTGQSPQCTCVPGYTLDTDGTHCVADTWALPGVILLYNEGRKLNAANLSALADEDRSRLSRPFVQLHRSQYRIDAVGMSPTQRYTVAAETELCRHALFYTST